VISVDPNTNVLLDVAFHEFSSEPSDPAPIISESDEETSASQHLSPLTTRALDLAFESLL
jgi:hypothetical protein